MSFVPIVSKNYRYQGKKMLKESLNSLKKSAQKRNSLLPLQTVSCLQIVSFFSPTCFHKKNPFPSTIYLYHSYSFMATYAHVIRQLRTQIEINRDKHWVHLLVVVGGGFFFLVAVTKKVTKNPKCAERGNGSLV